MPDPSSVPPGQEQCLGVPSRDAAETLGPGVLPVADEHDDFAVLAEPRDPEALAAFRSRSSTARPTFMRSASLRAKPAALTSTCPRA